MTNAAFVSIRALKHKAIMSSITRKIVAASRDVSTKVYDNVFK